MYSFFLEKLFLVYYLKKISHCSFIRKIDFLLGILLFFYPILIKEMKRKERRKYLQVIANSDKTFAHMAYLFIYVRDIFMCYY